MHMVGRFFLICVSHHLQTSDVSDAAKLLAPIRPRYARNHTRCMHHDFTPPLSHSLVDVCRLLHMHTPLENIANPAQFQRRTLKPGQAVYRMGQTFEALYVVNAGFLKTVLFDGEGNERVAAFPMKGDLLGCDGISMDCHASEVVALSQCELIVLPFQKLLALGQSCKELEHLIFRLVSRQVVHEQAHLVTLGSLRSDARVARFLSMQAANHAALRFSPLSFRLRMTRREIGSYLGLTLETVSRTMSALDSAGIVAVDQRSIKILKPDVLRSLYQVATPKRRNKEAWIN
jgi:CRP/FNR family transcriptional regulator, anaerobic regulatory protein